MYVEVLKRYFLFYRTIFFPILHELADHFKSKIDHLCIIHFLFTNFKSRVFYDVYAKNHCFNNACKMLPMYL